LEAERQHAQQNEFLSAVHGVNGSGGGHGSGGLLSSSDFNEELQMVLDYVQKVQSNETEDLQESWLRKPVGYTPNGKKLQTANGQLVSVISYCFELIKYLSLELNKVLKANLDREEKAKESLIQEFEEESENDKDREWERQHMAMYDPRNEHHHRENGEQDQPQDESKEMLSFGNHLAPLSKIDAMRRVEGQYRSNNAPVGTWDRQSIHPDPSLTINKDWKTEKDLQNNSTMTALNDYHEIPLLPSVYNYQSLEELVAALTTTHKHLQQSMASVSTVLVRKDLHYKTIKQELTTQLVEKRQREEEVVNWSFILKYLLASSTKLRKQLQVERSRSTATAAGGMGMNGNASVIRGAIVNSNGTGTGNQRLPATVQTMNANASGGNGSGKMGAMPTLHQPVFVPVLGSSSAANNQQFAAQQQQQRPQQQRAFQHHRQNDRDFDESGSIVSEAPPPPPPLSINVPTPRTQQHQPIPLSTMSSTSHGPQPSPMERLFNNNSDAYTPFVQNESQTAPPPPAATANNSRPNSQRSMQQPYPHQQQGLAVGEQQQQQRRPSQDHHVMDDENEEEDDEEDLYQNGYDYADDSEYSLTSTTRSFRSAATPNSIPLPHYRKSTRSKGGSQQIAHLNANAVFQSAQQHMQQQQQGGPPSSASQSSTGSGTRVVARMEIKDIRNSNPRSRNGSRSSSPNLQQQQQQIQPQHSSLQPMQPYPGRSITPGGAAAAPPSSGTNRNSGPVGIADNGSSPPVGKKKSTVPSSFAQEVVKSLGVQGEQAIAAMSVIDRVSSITPEQLAALDEETRQQILQIRKDLGIDHLFDASGRRAVNVSTIPGFVTTDQRKQKAEQNHIQRTGGGLRANSAPRSRSSTIETSTSVRPRSITPSAPRSPNMQHHQQQQLSPLGGHSDAYSQASHQSRASMPMSAITQSSFGTTATGNQNRMMMQQQQPQQQRNNMRSPQRDYRQYQGSIDDRSPLTATTTYSEQDQGGIYGQQQFASHHNNGRQFRQAGNDSAPTSHSQHSYNNRSVSPATSVGSHGSNRWANFAANPNPNMNSGNPSGSHGAVNANGRSVSPQRLPQQVSFHHLIH
jgi:hypothetical protein